MKLSGVFFDLDGTILDSFSSHYTAYEKMFARFGITITPERFIESYSPDWYVTYRAFGLPENDWDRANAYWLEEVESQSPPPFDGAAEMLAFLRSQYRLGIVTSGSRKRVERDLDRAGLLSHFDVVMTGDDVVEKKPAPEGLQRALDMLKINRDEAIYVGDARADYEMATNAGVRFVGVESRFRSLDATCHAPRVDRIANLPRLLHIR